MAGIVTLDRLDTAGLAWAQATVTRQHYRHSAVPGRASPEGWSINVADLGRVGCLLVGRPQATTCRPWYGSVEASASGRCEVTRWQVLNLARVWLEPKVQGGGDACGADYLPGYVDRRGRWRPTLASTAVRLLIEHVGFEYLIARPPVFVEEPYELRWLLSYCDTRMHRGVIYRAAGFGLYRTNAAGLQTWRIPLPPLTTDQHEAVRRAAEQSLRSRRIRAARDARQAQLAFEVAA